MMIGRIEYDFCKARHKRVYLSCHGIVTAYFFGTKFRLYTKYNTNTRRIKRGVVRFGLYLFLWGFAGGLFDRLVTNFSLRTSPNELLSANLSLRISPNELLSANLSLRIYRCESLSANLSLRISLCESIAANLSLRIYRCESIVTNFSLRIYLNSRLLTNLSKQ